MNDNTPKQELTDGERAALREHFDRVMEAAIKDYIENYRPVHDPEVEAIAREMAASIGSCDLCGSTDLRATAEQGLCKIKPAVCCNQCGELLAYG